MAEMTAQTEQKIDFIRPPIKLNFNSSFCDQPPDQAEHKVLNAETAP